MLVSSIYVFLKRVEKILEQKTQNQDISNKTNKTSHLPTTSQAADPSSIGIYGQ